MFQKIFELQTHEEGDIINITPDVEKIVNESGGGYQALRIYL